MNYLWGFMILISLAFSVVGGNVAETMEAGFKGAEEAIWVVMSFAGVMCLWTGFLKAAEVVGVTKIFKKLLSPIMRVLFPRLDRKSKAYEYMTMNITANLLGLGNGATPMGIKAMGELDKGGKSPTDEMCMFMVLNTAAFQIIPSTILALRSTFGSDDAFLVVVPIWITSGISLLAGILTVFITMKIRKAVRR